MITPRLQSILNYSHADVIADIGTDHAYIPISLINEKKARHVIASDLKEGPLNSARRNIDAAGLGEKIETRLGSGISVLAPGEAEQIIIAGMGGELIENILRENPEIAEKSELLLQPMNAQYELRKYLLHHGFTIQYEDISVEGFKVYNLMIAKKGEVKPFERDIDYQLPPYLMEHPFYQQLYDKKRREFTKVIQGIENAKYKDEEKLALYRFWLEEMEHKKRND